MRYVLRLTHPESPNITILSVFGLEEEYMVAWGKGNQQIPNVEEQVVGCAVPRKFQARICHNDK